MNFRIARNRVAAAALASVLVVAPAAPAGAVEIPWVQAPCATGAITQHAGFVDDQGIRRVTIAGWIQPCGEPVTSASFARIAYYPTGTLPLILPAELGPTGLYPYESQTTPTSFTFDYFVQDPPVAYGPVRAICVARSRTAPVACVAIDLPDRVGAPVVSPISTGDDRVTVPDRRPSGAKSSPTCGSCL
jgi:hypothetical protein